MRILYIDSDRALAANVAQALKRAGHQVDWQVELQKALNSADKKVPDVLILDMLLAQRSGTEFLYEFRSYPEWAHVPAIIYSSVPAHEVEAFDDVMLQLRIADYLYKPVAGLNQLLASVEVIQLVRG